MKHLDLWHAYKELDNLEAEQLKAAVKAHGGEYVFRDVEKDYEELGEEIPEMPCIMAAWKHCDCYEDYYITRVTVEDDELTLYGYPKDGWSADEHWIDSIAHGSYGWIIDMIPETENVKDVSDVGNDTLIKFINGRK